MDNIKRSFDKVKEDMDSLRYEVDSVKTEIRELRDSMVDICEIVNDLKKEKFSERHDNTGEEKRNSQNNQTNKPTELRKESTPDFLTNTEGRYYSSTENSTERQIRQTDSTENSTDKDRFKAQKGQNFSISTRNEGVPTDRQTDKQTNRQAYFSSEKAEADTQNSFNDAAGILDSLDNIKKDIRLKFKRLTEQEFLVFSTLYQLTDQHGSSDYKVLAKNLNLSGSSIRDYVGRLIDKGIPVEKMRLNNKSIQLSVSSELKKIASLPTIMELRGI